MPLVAIVARDDQKASTILDALCMTTLIKSRREGRDLMKGGGIYVNDVRVVENREISTDDILHGQYILMRRGKREYFALVFSQLVESP